MARQVLCAGQIVWVPTPERGYWAEWQFSPARAAYHFVGWVSANRLAYILGEISEGVTRGAA